MKSGAGMKHFRLTGLKTKHISEMDEVYSLVSFGRQMNSKHFVDFAINARND